jgi:hypothetical protein
MGVFTEEEKGFGAYRQGKTAARDYIMGGEMGVDPSAYQFGQTGFMDKMMGRGEQFLGRGGPVAQAAGGPMAAVPMAAAGPMAAAAPTAAQIAGMSDQLMGSLGGYEQMLQQRAMGAGPSAAQSLMQTGLDQALRQQMSMAGATTGAGRGLAMRSAVSGAAQQQGDLLGQLGAMRAQEQVAAQGQLGQYLGQQAQMDQQRAIQQAAFEQQAGMTGAQFQQQANMTGAEFQQQANMMGAQMQQQANMTGAQFQQQTAMANQAAELQQRQLNDQMMQRFMSMGMTGEQAQLQANMAMQQLMSQNYATAMGVKRGQTPSDFAAGMQATGNMLGGVGEMAGGFAQIFG